MTSLCSAGRDESGIVNQAQASADAQQLLQAGKITTTVVIYYYRNC